MLFVCCLMKYILAMCGQKVKGQNTSKFAKGQSTQPEKMEITRHIEPFKRKCSNFTAEYDHL